MITLYVKFALSLHFMACIWILLGRVRIDDNYLSRINMEDGWILRHHYVYSEYSMFETYVDAMALMTETISKVGYGMPYHPLNSSEMIFLIFIIMFSTNTLVMIFV